MAGASHIGTGREYLLHAFAALLVVVALFPAVFFRGEIALPGYLVFESNPWESHRPPEFEKVKNENSAESLIQYLTWSYVFVEAMKHGEWPLWNPYEMTGMPLHANFQSTTFYPTRVLFLLFELYTAATIFILIKIWICGMTAYACGRGIGLCPAAARFLSFGWMISGYCMNWLQWPEIDVAGWLPVAFLGVEWLLDARYRKGFFALSLGASLMLLGGHPETALAMGAGLGMYFFLRLAFERRFGRDVAAKIGLAGGAWVLALLVSAVVVVPFIEYCLHSYTMSTRHTGAERTQFIRPLAVTSLWIQRFMGFNADDTFWGARNVWENSQFSGLLYSGIVAWVGMAALFARSAFGSHFAKRAWALAIPSLLGLLLAVEFPTLMFYRKVPFLGSMWGIHHIAFGVFAVPLLGAMGFESWFRIKRRPAELLRTLPLTLGVVAVCIGFYFFYRDFFAMADLDDYMRFQYARAFLCMGAAFVLLVIHTIRPAPRLLGNLAALAICIDLLIATQNQLPTCPREHMYPDTPLTQWLQQQPKPCRVDTISANNIRPAAMVPYGIEELWGYDGIFPARIMRFMHQVREPSWPKAEPLLAVSFYLSPPDGMSKDKERFEHVVTMDGLDVLRDRRAYPRAFFLREVRAVGTVDELFATMGEPDFDSRQTGITEQPPATLPPPATSPSLGEIIVTDRTTTRMTLRGNAAEDCVLFVSEAYYPGWRAYVDGTPAEVFPLFHAFRGVVFPKGEHTVEFRFESATFYVGLWCSIAALLISGAAALRIVLRRA